MSRALILVLVPALALVLTTGLTALVRRIALSSGTVAQVRADRWHRKPTPAVGGIAIFAGFGVAVLVGTLLSPDVTTTLEADRGGIAGLTHWQALVVAGSVLFVVGVVDDLIQLAPLAKLGGQLLGAGILVVSGIGIWITGIYVVDVLVSLLWFVAVTNALNLLDNMDGLAAGTGAIAAGVIAVLLLLDGHVGVASLALALSGSLVGFLAHNYPPARIFMGDSGSLFLGIFLAGLAVAPAPGLSRGLFAVVAVPALVLAVPLLDTTFVTVQRILEGRPVSEGGRDHTSHGLVSLGIDEKRAVWILWGLAAVGGGVGLLLRTADRALAGVLGGIVVVGLTLVGAYLLNARQRQRQRERERVRAGEQESDREPVRGRTHGPEGERSTASEAEATLHDRVMAFHERLPFFPFVLDVILVGLAYYAAYLIRWEPGRLAPELEYFQETVAIVVVVKLLAFMGVGIYGSRWRFFGLEDALRVVRANFFATLVAVAVLLLFQRVGLSRGVLLIDFFVCTGLILATRFSFRIIEGATRSLSNEGMPAVLVGTAEDAELAFRELGRLDGRNLRLVAVADTERTAPRGRFRGYPVFGGSEALPRAMESTGAHVVVLTRRGEHVGWRPPRAVREYLKVHGGLDVYVLDMTLDRWRGV
ncbi:MAG: hypothetical protein ACLFWG_08440 [Longimicrobiales bacterium]